jgi:hypothetical protein
MEGHQFKSPLTPKITPDSASYFSDDSEELLLSGISTMDIEELTSEIERLRNVIGIHTTSPDTTEVEALQKRLAAMQERHQDLLTATTH